MLVGRGPAAQGARSGVVLRVGSAGDEDASPQVQRA